jgi:G6PDH family F420-dependent oxidoreductase
VRIHPAVIAQAAATSAAMMPGRFFLGVGSGENLNEHILGDRWPEVDVRLEMLEESVEVMRQLWQGGYQSHHGKHYTVENARLYTLPEEPVEVMVAASGPKAAELAGRIGDGFVGTSPDTDTIEAFRNAGGSGKPLYGQATVCWAESEEAAVKTAHRIWPNGAITGSLSQELPLPEHFEQAAKMVSEDDIAEAMPCGPDPERHQQSIREYIDAGYTHVYIHQIGPDQQGFMRFYAEEILPKL